LTHSLNGVLVLDLGGLMKSKGYIFDLLKLENGYLVTLFSFIQIGYSSGDEFERFFKCIQFGFGKLVITFSLGWKSSLLEPNTEQGYS
jgi:hypothetical protein